MGALIICTLIFIALLIFYFKFFSIPRFGNMIVVSGAVKAGKSTFSFRLAEKQYQRQLREYRFDRYLITPILRIFKKNVKPREMPLFYSNIPCAVKNYAPLTQSLLLREERFRYGSVIYVDEASLVADSMLIKNADINEQLLLFNKLIGHETHGGYLIYNTQSVNDMHFSIKRCVGSYFYVHHNFKLPFFVVMCYREMFYSDDVGSSSAVTVNDDAGNDLKRVLVPKSVWRKFDCYCYSAFTDDLSVRDNVVVIKKKDRKKVNKIVSFRQFKNMEVSKDD